MHIKYEWDEGKRHQNLAKHGVDFDVIVALVWTSALVIEDRRMDYGEVRLRVLGLIGDRVHAVVVTPRTDALRVISLRKANAREVKQWQNR